MRTSQNTHSTHSGEYTQRGKKLAGFSLLVRGAGLVHSRTPAPRPPLASSGMRFAPKRSKTTTSTTYQVGRRLQCREHTSSTSSLRCCASPFVACRRIVQRTGSRAGPRAHLSRAARNRGIVPRRPALRELGRAHCLVLALRLDAVLHPTLGADKLLGEGPIGERLLGRNRAVPPVDGALRFVPLHEVAMNRGEVPPPRPFDHRLILLPACPLYLQRDGGC